jgi:predicted RNase H-like nuclease
VDLVAVDMPLSYSPIMGRRKSDDEVSRAYEARGSAAHSPSATRPGRIGRELRKGFRMAGYPLLTHEARPPGVIEVYPHPALIELTGVEQRLPYKATKARCYWGWATPAQRRDLLFWEWGGIVNLLRQELAGIEAALPLPSHQARDVELRAYEDALDAIICAWAAVCALDGRAVAFGDDSSAIWIPRGKGGRPIYPKT